MIYLRGLAAIAFLLALVTKSGNVWLAFFALAAVAVAVWFISLFRPLR